MLQKGYPKRIYCTEADQLKIFERWLQGESQGSIARSFGSKNKLWRIVCAAIAASIDLPEAEWLQAFGSRNSGMGASGQLLAVSRL